MMTNTNRHSVSATCARPGLTTRRVRLFLRAVPALLRVAWSYWRSPPPAETFTFDVPIRGRRRTVTVDAFYPKAAASKTQAPAVILLHGVDGAKRYASNHYLVAGALARQGYAVYFVHYFDSVDYDDLWLFDAEGQLDVRAVEEFSERDKECWIAAVTAALCEIAARPEVDSSQIALFGYSLGCFVSLSAAEESLRQTGLPRVAAVVGHWGAKFPEATFSAGFPPTRLFHGAQDPVVLLDWARQTLDSLRAIGVDVALMEIPRQGHRATSRKAWRETLAFLRRQVVGEVPAAQPLAGRLRLGV